MQLRPYQIAAVASLRSEFAQGRKRVVLVAPTGSGKTTIAGEMIRSALVKSRAARIIFLAHRRELISQCSDRLASIGVPHGIIQAGVSNVAHSVQVASVQTLIRRQIPAANLVIIDECHHARAGSYTKILDALLGVPVVGLSATPWRTDGRGLGALFDGLVVAARPGELVAAGFLCPVTGFAYDNPDLSAVRTTGGDFEDQSAAQAMGYIGGNIVTRWLDFRPGRTVVFACTIAHSMALAESFRAAGVAAEHLDGTTPTDERAAILARLAAGTTEVVCNVGVLTEGWDLPALQCVVLARPTKSVGLYLQMAGRGLRPADGKTVARIHDHAGNAIRHGLVDSDRDYTLDGDTRRAGVKAPPTASCPKCFAIHEPAPACPACGHVYERKPRTLNEIVGHEVAFTEIKPATRFRRISEGEARALMADLAATGAARSFKPGWAAYQFKQRTGFWPRREWSQGGGGGGEMASG